MSSVAGLKRNWRIIRGEPISASVSYQSAGARSSGHGQAGECWTRRPLNHSSQRLFQLIATVPFAGEGSASGAGKGTPKTLGLP